MRGLSVCLMCITTLAACSRDPSLPVAPPTNVDPSRELASATWNLVFLDPSPNYVRLIATAVSNRGHIAGYEVNASGGADAFIQKAGKRRYLMPYVGHTNVELAAINDLGAAAGVSYQPNAGSPLPIVYWDSDKPSPVPGVSSGSASDVSESGWIVGTGSFPDASRRRGFLWRRDWAMPLVLGDELPAGIETSANRVTNAGYVAGSRDGKPGIWTPTGQFQPIPLPPGATSGWASEMNDAGQVAGSVCCFRVEDPNHPPDPYHHYFGFVWTASKGLTLLAPPGTHTDVFVIGIDRRGRVYANYLVDGVNYPLVWISGLLTDLGGRGPITDVNDCGIAVGRHPFDGSWLALTEC